MVRGFPRVTTTSKGDYQTARIFKQRNVDIVVVSR